MAGYTSAIANMTHEDVGEGKNKPLQRIINVCVGFAIASLGNAMIGWGGLISVTFFGSLTIHFLGIGIVIGVISGLLNIDKNVALPNALRPRQ